MLKNSTSHWQLSSDVDCECRVVLMKVFIGHAESISSVMFMPDSKSLVSFGEAIFVWDFLASESGNFVLPAAE